MSYTDRNLMAGEIVVYRTRLHWILLVVPAMETGFFILLTLLTFVSRARPFALVWLFFALLTGIMLLGRYVLYRTSEFAVTNKRVLIKVGALRQRSIEILLAKVEAIGVDQPLLGRLLDYGSLMVGGTGGTKELFHRIHAPLEFRKNVQEQTAAGA